MCRVRIYFNIFPPSAVQHKNQSLSFNCSRQEKLLHSFHTRWIDKCGVDPIKVVDGGGLRIEQISEASLLA